MRGQVDRRRRKGPVSRLLVRDPEPPTSQHHHLLGAFMSTGRGRSDIMPRYCGRSQTGNALSTGGVLFVAVRSCRPCRPAEVCALHPPERYMAGQERACCWRVSGTGE